MVERNLGRAIAGKAAVSVVGIIAVAATYALVVTWIGGDPWTQTLRFVALLVGVLLVRDGLVGLWRLRYRREAFVRESAREKALRFFGLRRTE